MSYFGKLCYFVSTLKTTLGAIGVKYILNKSSGEPLVPINDNNWFACVFLMRTARILKAFVLLLFRKEQKPLPAFEIRCMTSNKNTKSARNNFCSN